jgi:hypothetical protein
MRLETMRIQLLMVASLLLAVILIPIQTTSADVSVPPRGVSKELWTAYKEVGISNLSGVERNLRWTASPTFYITGEPTFDDSSTFRQAINEIAKYCSSIKPSVSNAEPSDGAVFHYIAPDRFKSIIPEIPSDVTDSYSWIMYRIGGGATKFTAVFSKFMSQIERDRQTQIRVFQAMGLRGQATNRDSRMFSWVYPYSDAQTASELDKQLIRLYCSAYVQSGDTIQETFNLINTAWTKSASVSTLDLNIKTMGYKGQINYNFNFDPSRALDYQMSEIRYRILDPAGASIKSGTLEVSANLFKTYSIVLSGIKDKTLYTIEAYPVSAKGNGSVSRIGAQTGTQFAPTDAVGIDASDASAEVIDARKAASDAIDAGNEALALFGRYKDGCTEVSTQFETEAQELFDTTSLNTYCEQLDDLVSELDAKIGALDTDKATTTDQANKLTDTANTYAEEADELVALIQDITDELLATEKQLSSIVKLLEPINFAETEIVDGWEALAERIALLPRSSQATIKKSSSYKSALAAYTQAVRTIASRDNVLEKLGSLEDPRKLSDFVSQLSLLKINTALVSTFKKSLTSLNKGIPSKVCIKDSSTLLPSKSGKCPAGYEQVPTQ